MVVTVLEDTGQNSKEDAAYDALAHSGICAATRSAMLSALTNTRFFKRVRGNLRPTTYWGRLGQRLVESDKKVIVYDIRGVLHETDTVEDATDFYVRQKSEGRIGAGGVYLHHDRQWQPVNVGEMEISG